MRACTIIDIEWGSLILVAGSRGIQHLRITRKRRDDARRLAERSFPDTACRADLLNGLQRRLRDYFEGRPVIFQARLDLSGITEFQQQALEACAGIPYGRTVSYGELARDIGRPGAARAVGSAMARNPIPIIIPCHRVIGANGTMCGYTSELGVDLKRRLLAMEARAAKGS